MACVSRGNPSSTPRLHCGAMSFKDLVMQGIRNTHSTGMCKDMCKVLVKYTDWHRIITMIAVGRAMQEEHRLSSCSNLDRPSSSSLCQWSEESESNARHLANIRSQQGHAATWCLFRNQCGSLVTRRVTRRQESILVEPRWASRLSLDFPFMERSKQSSVNQWLTKPRGNQRYRTLSTGRPVVPFIVPCRAVSSRRRGRALWWTCPSSGRPSKPLAGLPPAEHKASWKQKDQKNPIS